MLERIELQAFLTLAEELHFGRTAQRLGVSAGRISQTIKHLEERIGAPLFERTSRTVRLTDIGRTLHEDLRPATELLTRALDGAREAARGLAGPLRVGFSAPWCGELVMRTADAFRISHPACEVSIREIQLNDPLGPLRKRTVDLQLTEFPIREPDISTGPVIYRQPRALLVPATHPFAARGRVSIEDLADSTLIAVVGDIPAYWLEHHFPRRTPKGRHIPHAAPVTYWQETLSHVAMGRGVSPLADRAQDYFSYPGTAFVALPDMPPIEYGLLWPTESRNRLAQAFLQTLHSRALREATTT